MAALGSRVGFEVQLGKVPSLSLRCLEGARMFKTVKEVHCIGLDGLDACHEIALALEKLRLLQARVKDPLLGREN